MRTVARGYALLRDGAGDQLLLKRGDAWHGGVPAWRTSGASADPREDDEDPPVPVVAGGAPAEVAVDSSATGSVKLVTAPDTIGAPTVTTATAPTTSSRGTRRGRRRRRAHRESEAAMREESGGPAGMWCTRADPHQVLDRESLLWQE